jgi:hypothetical protein
VLIDKRLGLGDHQRTWCRRRRGSGEEVLPGVADLVHQQTERLADAVVGLALALGPLHTMAQLRLGQRGQQLPAVVVEDVGATAAPGVGAQGADQLVHQGKGEGGDAGW